MREIEFGSTTFIYTIFWTRPDKPTEPILLCSYFDKWKAELLVDDISKIETDKVFTITETRLYN